MKLNIGCGHDIKKGWINIDKEKIEGIDLVMDLNYYPYLHFGDNSVDEIQIFHTLEHVKDFRRCFKELTRILKVGGKLHIKVPHFSGASSNCEFHHTRFTSRSFETSDHSTRTKFDSKGMENKIYDKHFKTIYRRLNFYKKPSFVFFLNYITQPIINLNKYLTLFWEYTFLSTIFPAMELEVILIKEKK